MWLVWCVAWAAHHTGWFVTIHAVALILSTRKTLVCGYSAVGHSAHNWGTCSCQLKRRSQAEMTARVMNTVISGNNHGDRIDNGDDSPSFSVRFAADAAAHEST